MRFDHCYAGPACTPSRVSTPWFRTRKNSRPSSMIQRKRLLTPIESPTLSYWSSVIQEICDRWVSRHVRSLASSMTRLRDHVETKATNTKPKK